MSKQIKCRNRGSAGFYAPNGEHFTLPAQSYLLINEEDLTPERTMNGGGFVVTRDKAYHPDSGATSTQTIWVDIIDPDYQRPAAN